MTRYSQSTYTLLPSLAMLVATACGPATKDMPAAAPAAAASSAPMQAPPPAVTPAPPAAVEAPKAEEHHAPHWTYAGDTGVTHWGDLSPEWATCKTGTSQSPIDLVSKSAVVDKKLAPIEFSYAKLPLSLFNNGHTVQVPNTTESSIKLAGQSFKLVQFHLHSPSEHLVDGKPVDLELHLVHKNDQGQLTVVGLLYKKGKENSALAPVFNNAPANVSDAAKPVNQTEIDLSSLLPTKRNYFNYSGSLTTPPCTEGVNWIVLQTLGEVSEAQITKFRAVTHGDTVRPAQPLGSRKVSRNQ